MILPCASRWTISIGWMTRQRMRTTSPALTLDGTRMRILPMSLIPSAPAAADGDLHLALRRQQCPVALLDDGADVGRLAEADVGADERLAGLRRPRRERCADGAERAEGRATRHCSGHACPPRPLLLLRLGSFSYGSSRNADGSGLKARGSHSGRRRLPGPGAGRASASHWR